MKHFFNTCSSTARKISFILLLFTFAAFNVNAQQTGDKANGKIIGNIVDSAIGNRWNLLL